MSTITKKNQRRKPLKFEEPEPHNYVCSACGLETINPVGKFYKSPWSDKYKANDGYVTLCKDCVNDLYKYYAKKFDPKTATIICCHLIDIPFIHELYESNKLKSDNIGSEFGSYMRSINGKQYNNRTFCTTLVDGTLTKTEDEIEEKKEEQWTKVELDNKITALQVIGYDPFLSYPAEDRRILFSEIIKYFDEDTDEDNYKLSQIIQIVNNNNQIRNCDLIISKINARADADEIKKLNSIKKDLVASNDKIAKENEISVKNRSNKESGRSTLTKMMKSLREQGFTDAEHNYYDQLKSEGTYWAAMISTKSMMENCLFDENDVNEIIEIQRNLIAKTQDELDTSLEETRLLKIQVAEMEGDLKAYRGLNK